MNKAIRMLSGGWLDNALSHFTRGWFGELASVTPSDRSINIAEEGRDAGIGDDKRRISIAKNSRAVLISEES